MLEKVKAAEDAGLEKKTRETKKNENRNKFTIKYPPVINFFSVLFLTTEAC
jgi:hypothetical protein